MRRGDKQIKTVTDGLHFAITYEGRFYLKGAILLKRFRNLQRNVSYKFFIL